MSFEANDICPEEQQKPVGSWKNRLASQSSHLGQDVSIDGSRVIF